MSQIKIGSDIYQLPFVNEVYWREYYSPRVAWLRHYIAHLKRLSAGTLREFIEKDEISARLPLNERHHRESQLKREIDKSFCIFEAEHQLVEAERNRLENLRCLAPTIILVPAPQMVLLEYSLDRTFVSYGKRLAVEFSRAQLIPLEDKLAKNGFQVTVSRYDKPEDSLRCGHILQANCYKWMLHAVKLTMSADEVATSYRKRGYEPSIFGNLAVSHLDTY